MSWNADFLASHLRAKQRYAHAAIAVMSGAKVEVVLHVSRQLTWVADHRDVSRRGRRRRFWAVSLQGTQTQVAGHYNTLDSLGNFAFDDPLDFPIIASNVGFSGVGPSDGEEFVRNPRFCEMTVRSTLAAAVFVAFAAGASPALAEIIFPVSTYEMRNGDGQAQFGTYNYWDATYSGSGPKTTDGTINPTLLTGGKGALTDGTRASFGFGAPGVSNNLGTGQYVGWKYFDPTISFALTNVSTVETIHLFVDAGGVGLVGAPDTVTVNGVTYDPTVNYINGADSTAIELIIALNDPITASIFQLTLHAGGLLADSIAYNLQYPNGIPGDKQPWMMVSEIEFHGVSAVPELSTWAMMLIGFGLFGFVAYRRKLNRNPAVA